LIVKEKRGKYYWCKINRNKKNEIKELLAILEKWNSNLNNPDISILRIHNYSIYSSCSIAYYDRFCFSRVYPNNRVCIVGNLNLCSVSVDLLLSKSSQTNPIQIFIKPFYLIVNNQISEEELEIKINKEITNRYFLISEELEFKGIKLSHFYEVNSGHIAIQDDWLANFAIKNHIKIKDTIDTSHYKIPEYEEKGINAVKFIHNVIKERRKWK